MRRGKGILAVILTLLVITGLSAGCGGTKKAKSVSLYSGDPDAMRIFVWGNSNYEDVLVEKFPDVEFDFYKYNGLSATTAMTQVMKQGDLGDIYINSLRLTDEDSRKYLMDLSGMTVCGKYEPSMLNQYDIDGAIYQLPGSISIRCILYNKGMFEEHGWKEPQSFGELVELCRQIREETDDVTPIVMGGATGGYYFTTMTTYSQSEYLYKPEGAEWAKKYAAGKASANEGFAPGFEMVQELMDAQAFDFEKNEGLWDRELFSERMNTDEAAMMFVWGSQDAIAREIEESSNEYGVMPFRNRGGSAFLGTTVSYNIGLSKELEEKGNEKKLEDAIRIIEWLSSSEGIYSVTNDTSSSIFPLKDEENLYAFRLYQDLWEENLDCIKAPMLYAGYEDVLVSTGDAIMAAVKEGGSLDGIPDQMDEIRREYLEGGSAAIEVGSFSRDFTHEETLQLLTAVLQEMGDSDISMVSDGSVKGKVSNNTGGHMVFYEGSLMEEQLTYTLPGDRQVNPCVQMKLTGAQIKDLIEKGKHVVMFEGDKSGKYLESAEGAIAQDYFDYYWSGMKVKMEEGRVASMELDDGTKMEDQQSYTVAFAPEDYTDGVMETGNPVELAYSAQEALRAYLQKHSPVSPVEVCR